MRRRIYLVLAVIVLLGLVGWTSYGQKQNQSRTTWEYISVNGNDYQRFKGDATLNELGTQGWELVSVATYSPGDGAQSGTVFYFKRKRSQ